jgi:hypothetical protein
MPSQVHDCMHITLSIYSKILFIVLFILPRIVQHDTSLDQRIKLLELQPITERKTDLMPSQVHDCNLKNYNVGDH